MSKTITTTTAPVGRSALYYFTEVTFQVEDVLYRVPRDHFERQSDVFRDMFQLPVPAGKLPDGSSDERPLLLEGIRKEDFQQLLRVMFPAHPRVPENLSFPQWISVLHLSALWNMEKLSKRVLEKMSASSRNIEDWTALLDMLSINHPLSEARTLAIQKISSISGSLGGTQMVLLGRKYHVRNWVRDGIRQLVSRGSFSEEEETMLGSQTLLKLYRIREDRHREEVRQLRETSSETPSLDWTSGAIDWGYEDPGPAKLDSVIGAGIEKEFGGELEAIQQQD